MILILDKAYLLTDQGIKNKVLYFFEPKNVYDNYIH